MGFFGEIAKLICGKHCNCCLKLKRERNKKSDFLRPVPPEINDQILETAEKDMDCLLSVDDEALELLEELEEEDVECYGWEKQHGEAN